MGTVIDALRKSAGRGFMRAVFVAVVIAGPCAQATPVEIKVMTQNLYLGADLAPVIGAIQLGLSDTVIAAVTAATYGKVVASDPAARIGRVADEILTHMPHAVGLQEMVTWQTRPFLSMAPFTDTFNFFDLLDTALGGPASPYTLVTRFDGDPVTGVGASASFPPTEIRLTDGSGLLVRNDVLVNFAASQEFTIITSIPPPVDIDIRRAINYADIVVGGNPLRVANVHLDSLHPGVNNVQSQELINLLGASPHPQIAFGDFNTFVEPPGGGYIPTGSDTNMLMAGFTDAWLAKGSGPGFTWRDDELLSDPDPSLFFQRLDYVFHRGSRLLTDEVELLGSAQCPPPCWASDHLGVLATIVIPLPGSFALLGLGLGLVAWRRRVAR
jgi:hypothetical protein